MLYLVFLVERDANITINFTQYLMFAKFKVCYNNI